MNKINNSVIMSKSAENPATTHTHDRYADISEKLEKYINSTKANLLKLPL